MSQLRSLFNNQQQQQQQQQQHPDHSPASSGSSSNNSSGRNFGGHHQLVATPRFATGEYVERSLGVGGQQSGSASKRSPRRQQPEEAVDSDQESYV